MLSLLADLLVLLHAAFVLFVVVGQCFIVAGWLLAWQWTRWLWPRLLHLVAIAYVVAESWLGIPCPLTVWEHQLRRAAGETVENISFIGYWLNYVLYYRAPDWVFTLVYSLFGALVVLTFIFYPPRFHENHQC